MKLKNMLIKDILTLLCVIIAALLFFWFVGAISNPMIFQEDDYHIEYNKESQDFEKVDHK